MNPSRNAQRIARHQWEALAHAARTPEQVARTVDRASLQLRMGLSRWIGKQGHRSLLERAVLMNIEAHPVLGDLALIDEGEGMNATAVEEHGVDRIADAMVVLLATVIELLGRLIGEPMAMRLVDHWANLARTDQEESTDSEDQDDA